MKNKGKAVEEILKKICQITIIIVKICLLLISGFLAWNGVRYSYFSSPVYSERIFEVTDSTVQHLLFFAVICVFWGIMLIVRYRLGPYVKNKLSVERVALLAACVWLLALGLLYVSGHPYYPEGDQLNTTAGAAYARAGNYVMFIRGGYIGLHEHQKGYLFLYEILFTIFGDFCYKTAACFHVGFSVMTLIAGYSFLEITAKKPSYRILYCVMMMFCMPYMLFLPYIYGDLPSICFSTVLFWALAAYGKHLQKRYIVIGAIAAALALLSRTNSYIVLIAVMIGMVLMAMEKKTLQPLLACFCIILTSVGAVKAVEKMYEYRSGYESGVGIPTVLRLATGLQETDGNPGIYNRYHQSVYEQCGFDQEEASQVGKEYISSRLEEFRDDPAYTRCFFDTKMKMQWLEPLFESLYATNSFQVEEGEEIPGWVMDLYDGKLHDIVWKSANYYQSIVYLAMTVFAADSLLRNKKFWTDSAGWIPVIAVVGGFLFSIIWEAQCRYVLPYYMYMLLYASVELGKIAEAVCGYGEKLFVYTSKGDS